MQFMKGKEELIALSPVWLREMEKKSAKVMTLNENQAACGGLWMWVRKADRV